MPPVGEPTTVKACLLAMLGATAVATFLLFHTPHLLETATVVAVWATFIVIYLMEIRRIRQNRQPDHD